MGVRFALYWEGRSCGEVEDLGELCLPLLGEVVADEDEGQVGVAEKALFYDVGIFLG